MLIYNVLPLNSKPLSIVFLVSKQTAESDLSGSIPKEVGSLFNLTNLDLCEFSNKCRSFKSHHEKAGLFLNTLVLNFF